MLLKLIPIGTKIPFVRLRIAYFIFSGLLLIAAATSYSIRGLNFGIDFRGGILIEVRAQDIKKQPIPANIAEMRRTLSALKLGEVALQSFGETSDVLIRVEAQTGGDKSQAQAIESIRNAFSTVAFTQADKRVADDVVMPGVLNNTTIGEVRQRLAKLKNVEVRPGANKNVDIVLKKPGDDPVKIHALITEVKTELSTVDFRRQEYVGPKVGGELIRAGIIATVLALGAILIYVWFRFEWQFGVAAVVALAHDVLLTVGLFSELQLEVGLTTVAAVLTIAGYSINDTVVVFDRVRENLRKYKKMALPELMNLSINETLSRTILTSFTTVLAVLALLIFGGQVIRDFSIALIWGVVIGTYSSICLAVPLLLMLNIKRGQRAEGEPEEAGATPVVER